MKIEKKTLKEYALPAHKYAFSIFFSKPFCHYPIGSSDIYLLMSFTTWVILPN